MSGLSTCPACAQPRQPLGEKHLEFVEYSLDTDQAVARLGAELGIGSVPVVCTASHRISGSPPPALAEHLRAVPGA